MPKGSFNPAELLRKQYADKDFGYSLNKKFNEEKIDSMLVTFNNIEYNIRTQFGITNAFNFLDEKSEKCVLYTKDNSFLNVFQTNVSPKERIVLFRENKRWLFNFEEK